MSRPDIDPDRICPDCGEEMFDLRGEPEPVCLICNQTELGDDE